MGQADSAQAEWDLNTAAQQYRRAVELDPDYALAWLHLAQLKAWQKHLDPEWRRAPGLGHRRLRRHPHLRPHRRLRRHPRHRRPRRFRRGSRWDRRGRCRSIHRRHSNSQE
jgi:hypothetical protein